MAIFKKLDGTTRKEFSLGVGDILTVNSPASGVRTTDKGKLEGRNSGGVWTPLLQKDLVPEPTGFLLSELPQATISVADATRTLSLTPTGASFRFFLKAVEITKTTAQSVVFPDVEGIHYFYFDSSATLVTTQSVDTWVDVLLGAGVLVSFITWDAVNKKCIFIGEERHGFMNGETHLEFHTYFGMQWHFGGALTNIIVNASGDLDTHAQFGVTDIACADEDLRFEFTHNNPQFFTAPAKIPIYYKLGASGAWRKKTADNFPLIYSGDGSGYVGANDRAPYNEWDGSTWKLTEVTDHDFFCVHYFISNEASEPFIGIQGQVKYNTRRLARTGAQEEIHTLVTTGLNIAEYREIATVIYNTDDGSFDNTPHTRIVSTDEGDDYIDWRYNARQGGGGGIADHGLLTGLSDDDHEQYLLVKDRLTTRGDLAVQDATGVTRLPLGDDGKVLGSDGTDVVWVTPSSGTDTHAVHVNTASEISGVTEKTGINASDVLILEDSEDSYKKKKTTVSNLVSRNIDGGAPDTIYMSGQKIDGGGP